MADPRRIISATLGTLDYATVDTKGSLVTLRSLVIVDPKMKVRLILSYPMSTGRSFAEVLRCVESLQRADLGVFTPADWKPGEDVMISSESARSVTPHRVFDDLPSGKTYMNFIPDPVNTRAEIREYLSGALDDAPARKVDDTFADGFEEGFAKDDK
uniref:Peroxiredoxin C-terminal domain-containing protein n=1 Tax=Pinguiococcus pyrenoidosus TaxID=172671 RepID=A0A7R9U466_9STRA